jgi:Clostridium epsilon toxin ETX/Bacillus mosquitocidal toxin MTX2
MPQEYLVWSDLAALNSSPSAVKDAFAAAWGATPDGIALNDTTYYNAVTPAITQQYGHYCYKTLGQIQYAEGVQSTPTQAIVGSNTAYNNSDQPASISLTVDGSWSESTSWSSSVTAGMTFSSEISLEGVFKMGMSFSVSTTVGQSKTTGNVKGSSATVNVTVPPHSMIKVDMVATMKTESMDFSAPIQVSGMMGVNFPDRVQGHYFWFNDVGSLLPQTSGTLTGTVQGTSAFDVQTHIGQAQPISG